MSKQKIVAIVGPTASGKTGLAVELAGKFNGEIVSCDSVQVYKGLDIGSAKPSVAELKGIGCRLIDVSEPDADYNAAHYAKDASRAIEEIRSNGKNVFVCGGTGLYLRALLYGLFEGPGRNEELREKLKKEAEESGRGSLYEKLKAVDPEAASKIHPNNIHRVIRALEVYYAENRPISRIHREHASTEAAYDALMIGIRTDRKELYEGIDKRVDEMIKYGFVEEVKRLLDDGCSPELKSMRSLGYKEIALYVAGHVTLDEAVSLIKKHTRNYAKRQLTWFNADKSVEWFSISDKTGIIRRVEDFLSQ